MLKNTMGREVQKNPDTENSTGPNAWLFHKTNCKDQKKKKKKGNIIRPQPDLNMLTIFGF